MYEGNLYSILVLKLMKKNPKKTNKQEHLEKISALWVPDQMGAKWVPQNYLEYSINGSFII